MKVLVIDNETSNLNDLVKLFKNDDINICNIGEDFDQNIYDLYIFSWWSHHSIFFKPNPYQKEIDFVKTTDKKVIWICLGCQIIAQAYDSIIDELPEEIIGIIDINYHNKTYKVFEAHRYGITSLWRELYGLAESKYGYEIIKHKTKTIRWFQFHPEKHMEVNEWRELLEQVINQSI